MKYIKQMICGIAVSASAFSALYIADAPDIRCEETYNVLLRAETVEIDINDIPENREVEVGIWIDNNPGFLTISYILEWNNKLSYDPLLSFWCNLDELNISNSDFNNNPSAVHIGQAYKDVNSLYYENGKISSIKLRVPDDIKIGDYYEVNFLGNYSDSRRECETFFRKENSFDSYYGPENFAPFINGGIRIVGTESSPAPVPETPPQQAAPPEPSQPQPNAAAPDAPAPENNQNTEAANQTESAVNTTASVQTTVTSASVTTTSEVTTVTENTTVTETLSETSAEHSATMITSSVSETTVPGTEKSEDKKTNGLPYIIALAAAGAALVIGIITKKKKENTSDK